MTKHLTVLFTIDQNPFNTTLTSQQREQLGVHQNKNYIKYYVQNLLGFHVGTDSCLFYKIFKNKQPQDLFHLILVRSAPYTTRNMHNLPIFKSKRIFSKTLFSRLLSLKGINQILAFIILKVFLRLSEIFFSLYDQLQILCIIVIILKALNLLRDFVLV